MTETAPVVVETLAPVVQETPPVVGTDNDLPAWAREKLTSAYAEAAAARVQKTEALSNAKQIVESEYAERMTKSSERITELEFEASAKSIELMKLQAILNAEIPSDAALDFASLVQGSTSEEIAASVEKIKGLYSREPSRSPLIDPTHGAKNTPLPLNGDGLLEAVKRAVGAK